MNPDDIVVEDYYELVKDINTEHNKSKKSKGGVHKYVYKLGEEINNGVRYFGQEKTNKNGKTYAMCICPVCGELWNVQLDIIRYGRTKSCGCKQKKASK